MPSEKFVLIIDKAKKKYREAGLEIDDVNEGLENLDELRLFYYENEKDREKSKSGRMAIPYDNGNYVLLMRRDSEDNDHFIAVDFWDKRERPVFLDGYDHLPLDNTRCQLLKSPHDIARYSDDAVDHQKLEQAIHNLEPWEPYDSNPEARKWRAYFELCKRILKSKKTSFSIYNIKIKDRNLSADIEGKKIKNDKSANGKDLIFSLELNDETHHENKVGKIKRIGPRKIEVEMAKEFLESYRNLIENNKSRFCVEGDDKSPIDILSQDDFNAKKLSDNSKEAKIKFTIHGEERSSFVASALIPTPDRHEEYTDDQYQDNATTCFVNKDTIQPLNLACSIDYFSDEFQLKVMKKCFDEVQQMPIWEVLSGVRVSKLPQEVDVSISSLRLNEEQKEAVRGALGAQELFLIWGPPGTGKTEVIKEIAKHESERGNKTLIVSQSNLAVDNALSRLFDSDSTYPLRIAKDGYELEGEDSLKVPFWNSVPRFYLEFLKKHIGKTPCEEPEGRDIQQQFLKDVEKRIAAETKKNPSSAERREIEQFAGMYKRKINVVGATLMESGKTKWLNKENKRVSVKKLLHETGIDEFDTVIIDEVSKATPPELFIPIPLGKKLILVGDYRQLPPMFNMASVDDKALEEWADELGISQRELDQENTIFERLWKRHTGDALPVKAMLREQYRMHPKIQRLIEQFYTDSESGESLICGLGEEEIQALDIDHDLLKDRPAIWVGTKGDSQERKSGTSFYNDDEIEKVGLMLDKLLDLNDKELSVGVITFYGAQLQKLKKEYSSYTEKFGEGKLIFGTVDRFQGRECDVIICSLVRNNKHGNIGFAKKPNRINVAFSRARKALIILGNRDTFPYNEKGGSAREKYKEVYDNCERPKPKEYSS